MTTVGGVPAVSTGARDDGASYSTQSQPVPSCGE